MHNMLVKKEHIERAMLFYIFANLCKPGLMEDSWIPIFASVFNWL